MTIKIGDEFTIAGVRNMRPNPDRRWWQLWKPRRVPAELKVFRVVEKHSA